MTVLKTDANRIRTFLLNLSEENWLKSSERSWWPKFVFHYTDIRNAVKILEERVLYSRKYLEENDKLIVSSGSSAILSGTNTTIKDCVRLYFRPKTPTQYYAEGICSQTTLHSSKFSDAHCPVPIFFLFDSAEILTRDDCYFSDGGLGSAHYQIFSTASELEQLPWKKLYHSAPYSKTEESDIAFRRNAEIIIPRKLDLKALRYIYCRSQAERETLLHLLPLNLQNEYQNKIIATTRRDLFYRRQTFIENVRLASQWIHVNFSPETQSPGPFLLEFELGNPSFGKGTLKQFHLKDGYSRKFSLPLATGHTIRLFLDGQLAYANKYEEMEMPF